MFHIFWTYVNIAVKVYYFTNVSLKLPHSPLCRYIFSLFGMSMNWIFFPLRKMSVYFSKLNICCLEYFFLGAPFEENVWVSMRIFSGGRLAYFCYPLNGRGNLWFVGVEEFFQRVQCGIFMVSVSSWQINTSGAKHWRRWERRGDICYVDQKDLTQLCHGVFIFLINFEVPNDNV